MHARLAFSLSLVGLVGACSMLQDDQTSDAIGKSKKQLTASEVVKANLDCNPGTMHPNVCCREDACYQWVDAPFLACDPGYVPIPDGARCCSQADGHCEAPLPVQAPVPVPNPQPVPPTYPPQGGTCGSAIDVLDCATAQGYTVSTYRAPSSDAEVNVIGVYETAARPYGQHPLGSANVSVTRTAHPQILVLSSYEPVQWNVNVAPGVTVVAVLLNGFSKSIVNAPPGIQVLDRTGPGNYVSACAYTYPDNGQGCSTQTLFDSLSSSVTSFAGCYQASQFVIHDDDPYCTTTPPPVTPPPPTSVAWTAYPFNYDRAFTDCAGGPRYVSYNARYAKWVGAELCSPTRYKLYLGEAVNGVFHEVGDFSGGGEDHCELVDPSFTPAAPPNGTCSGCSNGFVWDNPGPVPVYSRNVELQPFTLQTWPAANLYTSRWYECARAIP